MRKERIEEYSLLMSKPLQYSSYIRLAAGMMKRSSEEQVVTKRLSSLLVVVAVVCHLHPLWSGDQDVHTEIAAVASFFRSNLFKVWACHGLRANVTSVLRTGRRRVEAPEYLLN